MNTIKIRCVNDLSVPLNEAFHEGRVVLVGRKLRKRIMHQTSSGAIYVKWRGAKRYLSEGGLWVITNGVRK